MDEDPLGVGVSRQKPSESTVHQQVRNFPPMSGWIEHLTDAIRRIGRGWALGLSPTEPSTIPIGSGSLCLRVEFRARLIIKPGLRVTLSGDDPLEEVLTLTQMNILRPGVTLSLPLSQCSALMGSWV